MSADNQHLQLLAAWAAAVQANLRGGPPQAVRQGLDARVAASAAAHAGYRTVRRDASPWLPCGDGARLRWLRQDGGGQVALVALDDGAALPPLPGAEAVETLLAEGSLLDLQTGRLLPRFSHAVQPGGPPGTLRAAGPVLLYQRTQLAPLDQLPEAEARWWQARLAAARAQPGTGGWQAPGEWVHNRPGVQVLPLAAKRHVVSMLVRFEPGAGVPDHGHEIDEDCLVPEGEMFLGDILLRPGDYQLAPAGGGHFGETSDAGVLFFFHGAVDAALGARTAA